MNVQIDIGELEDACEWVSAGEAAGEDAEAFVNLRDGRIQYRGGGLEEDVPEDLDDEATWIAVPRLRELGLGRSLVDGFVEKQLPASLDLVKGFFRKSGAYARLKALLVANGKLEAWHAHERAATEESLTQWCAENGFTVSRGGVPG